MTSLAVAVFLTVVSLVAGICEDAGLGLSLQYCQPCGRPGLDDFCERKIGACGYYNTGAGNTAYGDLGGANGLPPFGYINNDDLPTTSCKTIKAVAGTIPNRAGAANTIPVYTRAADWGKSWPNIRVNPSIIQFLRILYPTHNCIENSLGFPNGRWNWQNAYDARQEVALTHFSTRTQETAPGHTNVTATSVESVKAADKVPDKSDQTSLMSEQTRSRAAQLIYLILLYFVLKDQQQTKFEC